MSGSIIKFTFSSSVPMPEVEATLRLAILAVESLHGADRLRLDVQLAVDQATRTCIIEATSDVGQTLALVFNGYVRREFGNDAVKVTHGSVASERMHA